MNEMMRTPGKGEVQMIVMVDDLQLHTWIAADKIEGLLEAFEKRIKATPEWRTDRLIQMQLRVQVAEQLRIQDKAQAVFEEMGAAACLWLALRHYAGGDDMRKGLTDQMAAGSAYLNIGIGNSTQSVPGTAWCFTVDAKGRDDRATLDQHSPEQVRIFGASLPGGWRGRTIRPTD